MFTWLLFLRCRINELQEEILKVKLELENSEEYAKHLNTQVISYLTTEMQFKHVEH